MAKTKPGKGRGAGKPFVKGDARAGRPKGVPNKVTLEVREAARQFVEDPVGQAKLLEQYQQGSMNPTVLQMLYHYAYGKPKDTLELQGGVAVTQVARVIIAGRPDAQD